MAEALLAELISRRLGLRVRRQDLARLREVIAARCESHGLSGTDDYARFLQATDRATDLEWKELAALMTTGETFFLRDKRQFNLLRQQILPELIDRHRADRSLHLWSAGCSSGEEPYTLATLMDELLSHENGWKVHILGSDINAQALEKAERGRYTSWSFRKVDPRWRDKYFHKADDAWVIDERIRSMVSFRQLNLLNDPFSHSLLRKVDLILCRNVFIYFEREHIASVIQKFVAAMEEGGYLITGHGELHEQDCDMFDKKVFSDSIAYQRRGSAKGRNAKRMPAVEIDAPGSSLQGTAAIANEGAVLKSKTGNMALAKDAPPIRQLPVELAAMQKDQADAQRNSSLRDGLVRARAFADVGDHRRAIECCEQALAANSFAVEPHYLLAHIAEEEGRRVDAKNYLKTVIYLEPTHLGAHLELANLQEQDGELQRAKKLRISAFHLLQQLDPDELVDVGETISAGQLSRQLKSALSHG